MSGGGGEQSAIREFNRQLQAEGFPDWGIRCKHGVQGGLYCEWCGNPDKLPRSKQISGVPRVDRKRAAS
jgi:hypothetical protein